MQAERPRIEEAIQAVLKRDGFRVTRAPSEHAGGKWRFRCPGALEGEVTLEVDLNFMLRVPLWPVVVRASRPVGSLRVEGVPVVDEHELAAGKLSALLSRRASRDLYDAHGLLTRGGLDPVRLRLAFTVYGAMNRRDWRTVGVEDVALDVQEMRQKLLALLREPEVAMMGDPAARGRRLVEECRAALGAVLPLAASEREFLDRLLEHGEVQPSLLTEDPDLADRIRRHPGLAWKALNVRHHRGL